MTTRETRGWQLIQVAAAAIALLTSGCAQSSGFETADAAATPPIVAPRIAEMGAAAFEDIRSRTPLSVHTDARQLVRCTGDALTRALGAGVDPRGQIWHFELFASGSASAFALPGGFAGVGEELLDHVRRPAQLAAAMSHGIAHVLAGHPEQRLAAMAVSASGAAAPAAGTSSTSTPTVAASAGVESRELTLAALGYGARIGEILPYSLAQESEADALSLQLMAKAGFDPRESVEIWKSLRRAAGPAGRDFPEFFAAHRADDGRIRRLYAGIGPAVTVYRNARALGHIPDCSMPR